MPQVELIRPIEVGPTGGSELTISNLGSQNAFYGTSATVSSTNKTGTLSVGESLTLAKGTVWLVAETTPVILNLREQAGASLPSGGAILGTDGTVGGPGGSPLSTSVIVSRPKPLAKVAGLTKVNLAEGYTTIPLELIGATEIEPYNAPANGSPVELIVNSGTGFAFSLKGVSWIGTEPTEFASGAAGKEYLTTLIPLEGKLLAIVGKGEKGAAGIQGEPGARGEVGPSSIEAMTRTSYPWLSGNAKATGSFVPTQWEVYYALVIVPVKAKKLEVYAPFKVISGHVRTFVRDCGVAAANSYTILAVSELYEPKTAEANELIATLERKDGKEWEPGEAVMVGIGADNTTIELPIGTALIKGSEGSYPGAAINGCAGMTTIRAVVDRPLTEASFKEANPVVIGEGSMGTTTVVPSFLCRWV
jgi:hypothetical protein